VANRRISELQQIAGIDLAEGDLLTVVDVGEVDPAIKNKKLTISGTKAYLNIYYLPRTGGTVSGSVLIQENLTVYGTTTTTGFRTVATGDIGVLYTSGDATVSGTFSGVTITGTNVNATNINSQIFTTTSFSAATITGISGTFTTRVSGQTVTGITGAFQQLVVRSGDINDRLKAGTFTGDYGAFGTITGVTGIYTTSLSGQTVTGTTANFTTGNFVTLNAGSHTITGDLTVTGDLVVRGSGYFSSGVQITGTLSGTTFTGSNGQFTNVTGVNVIGTTKVSGETITGGLGLFTTLTGNAGVFTSSLSGLTITGNTGNFTTLNAITATFTTGIVRENITVTGDANVNGDLFVYGSGFFSSGISVTGTVSGQTVTGTSGEFTTLTGGLGQFTTITGGTAGFTFVTGTTVSGTTANFVALSGTSITGDLANVTEITGVSGVFTSQISGATVTGDLLQATTGTFSTVSGSEFIAGGTTFVTGAGDVRPRGLFSFPTTVGTAGFVLQTNGEGTTSWVVPSGGGGGSTLTTIMQSKIVIDTNFGITSGYNGLSQGPVEIQDPFSVDVPSGSLWSIIG